MGVFVGVTTGVLVGVAALLMLTVSKLTVLTTVVLCDVTAMPASMGLLMLRVMAEPEIAVQVTPLLEV
jgi:hypothetical protein